MTDSNQSGLSDNSLGALAYITFIPALFFLAIAPYNRKPYVRFHAWQSFALNVFALFIWWILGFGAGLAVSYGITTFLVFEWVRVVYLAIVALLWIWCVVSAFNGRLFKLPLIGAWSERQANR